MRSLPRSTSTRLRSRTAVAVAVLLTAALFAPAVVAYEEYSDNRTTGQCATCHGNFRSSPYTSLKPGEGSWGDDLHDVHRNTMLDGDCDTCHGGLGGSRFPVSTYTSNGGDGFPAIGCIGCHGRDEGTGTVTGTGLRQHHFRAGETVCTDCHDDADPANATPVAESVLPAYYFTPDAAHPAKPTDPCNPPPTFSEGSFGATTLGLDNDGDGLYDGADPDCATSVCGNDVLEPGEDCDDGNTVDGDCCSSTCAFEAVGSVCDDGAFCTETDTCDGAGTCTPGVARSCDDGVGCTADSCDETADACVHVTNDAACDDGQFCNGAESCDAVNDCTAGTPVDCDDGDVCTDDACDEGADRCENVYDETNAPECALTVCGNGVLESGEDCDDGNTADGDCCSSTCAFEAAASPCDDGLFCTVGDTCDGAGACNAGPARDCADAVACTADSCDEASDTCVHTADDAACDDGTFCNGAEVCDPVSDCGPGVPVDCDDADVCTDDACNEVDDRCDNIYDETNAPECQVTECGNGRVEPGEDCDDGNTVDGDCCSAVCAFEAAASPCDDGEFCTVTDACDGAGTCVGSSRDCDDGVACTLDGCDDTADRCVHTPDDAVCDDGLFCTGVETCDPTADCTAGTPVDCDDAEVCTDDSCNDATDRCDHVYDETNAPECALTECGNGVLESGEDCDDGNTADGDCCSSACLFENAGSACDDGLFCTDGDACDGAGACAAGPARDCDDGVGCTADACDEDGAVCVHAPDDGACDDGVFCNGAESCDPVSDCVDGTAVDCDDADPCTDDRCDEPTVSCENTFDPTNAPECAAQCPDLDGDGFSTAGGNCGAVDCDDDDPDINPDADEVCTDHRDNDCDGLVDAADDACAVSGEWTVRSGPLRDDRYAGSTACAECHRATYDTWAESLHARLLIPPGDAQAAGFELPDDASLPGTEITAESWGDILFVVGQKWKSRWVNRDGFLESAQWNFRLARWSAYGGGPYQCGACHTTGYDPDATFEDDQGRPIDPIVGSWVEYNIGCEACHGPGAEHAGEPERENINRIELDWTATGEGIRTPAIRSAEVCGNCHYRNRRFGINDPGGGSGAQFSEWSVSPHASSVEPTSINTYCAKCHSPGDALADSTEHNFDYYEPKDATHVTCVSCHDPHGASHPRWATLEWPQSGRQDPKDYPATIGRYLGTDDNPFSPDHRPIANERSAELCTDCHRMQPGFRRHADASPDAIVELRPPFNGGAPFEVPHAEHVEQGYATCVDCHMPYSRRSINPDDVRTHSFLPNEWPVDGLYHFDQTCGQCHEEAETCTWCHAEFNDRRLQRFDSRRATPEEGDDRGVGLRPGRRLLRSLRTTDGRD